MITKGFNSCDNRHGLMKLSHLEDMRGQLTKHYAYKKSFAGNTIICAVVERWDSCIKLRLYQCDQIYEVLYLGSPHFKRRNSGDFYSQVVYHEAVRLGFLPPPMGYSIEHCNMFRNRIIVQFLLCAWVATIARKKEKAIYQMNSNVPLKAVPISATR